MGPALFYSNPDPNMLDLSKHPDFFFIIGLLRQIRAPAAQILYIRVAQSIVYETLDRYPRMRVFKRKGVLPIQDELHRNLFTLHRSFFMTPQIHSPFLIVPCPFAGQVV